MIMQVVFYLSGVVITWRTSSNIIYLSTNPTMIKYSFLLAWCGHHLENITQYNLPEYKSHHDQVVFYLSGVDITWRTSLNIYNLPGYKSHHDQI
jgi:hypothetical protein